MFIIHNSLLRCRKRKRPKHVRDKDTAEDISVFHVFFPQVVSLQKEVERFGSALREQQQRAEQQLHTVQLQADHASELAKVNHVHHLRRLYLSSAKAVLTLCAWNLFLFFLPNETKNGTFRESYSY